MHRTSIAVTRHLRHHLPRRLRQLDTQGTSTPRRPTVIRAASHTASSRGCPGAIATSRHNQWHAGTHSCLPLRRPLARNHNSTTQDTSRIPPVCIPAEVQPRTIRITRRHMCLHLHHLDHRRDRPRDRASRPCRRRCINRSSSRARPVSNSRDRHISSMDSRSNNRDNKEIRGQVWRGGSSVVIGGLRVFFY